MVKFNLLNKSLLLTCFAAAFTLVTSQQYESDPQDTTKLTQLEVSEELFTKPEINILQSADAVDISPLTLARRLQHAWMLGRKEMLIDLTKNATSPGLGLNLDKLIDRNQKWEFTMTPQELDDELTKAYQLGGLTVINRAVQMSHKALPEIREASPDEVRFMRLRHRQAIRNLIRGERMKQRIRLAKLGRGPGAEEEPTFRYGAKYSPVEHELDSPRTPVAHSSIPISRVERSSGEHSSVESSAQSREDEMSSDVEDEELNNNSDFVVNLADSAIRSESDIDATEFEANAEFETNQGGARERVRERRTLCPPQITCRNCRDRRYRNCEHCLRIEGRCEQRDVSITRRP